MQCEVLGTLLLTVDAFCFQWCWQQRTLCDMCNAYALLTGPEFLVAALRGRGLSGFWPLLAILSVDQPKSFR